MSAHVLPYEHASHGCISIVASVESVASESTPTLQPQPMHPLPLPCATPPPFSKPPHISFQFSPHPHARLARFRSQALVLSRAGEQLRVSFPEATATTAFAAAHPRARAHPVQLASFNAPPGRKYALRAAAAAAAAAEAAAAARGAAVGAAAGAAGSPAAVAAATQSAEADAVAELNGGGRRPAALAAGAAGQSSAVASRGGGSEADGTASTAAAAAAGVDPLALAQAAEEAALAAALQAVAGGAAPLAQPRRQR
eukprot:262686-Chlamydomonas_euryale.AAC.10